MVLASHDCNPRPVPTLQCLRVVLLPGRQVVDFCVAQLEPCKALLDPAKVVIAYEPGASMEFAPEPIGPLPDFAALYPRLLVRFCL